MMEAVQLTDIMGIDLIDCMSTKYIKSCAEFAPPAALSQSTEMVIHYIATTLEPTEVTASLKFVPTCTYDAAPRDLDILLIGGPLLTHRPPAADKFMKEAAEKTKVIMTTCVGSAWLASSGVLNGKKATTNRGFLPVAKQMYPEVDWQDERWTIDGKFWTSGGAGAGLDMVGTFIKEKFPKEIVEFCLVTLDFDPSVRGKHY
jgi:transcriptional regulator GlxA family with amidase domain